MCFCVRPAQRKIYFIVIYRPPSENIDLTLNIIHHGVLNYNISDHIPCFVIIKKSKETYTKCKFMGRSYLNYQKAQLHEMLLQLNWGRLYGCSDVNQAWSILYSTLLDCCDKLCPTKEFNIRRDKPPWYTDDLYELAKSRDELF